MGLLVSGNLPSGIPVSNVYMSFNGETVYVTPRDGTYYVSSSYRVFNDQTKTPGTDMHIPIMTIVTDISPGVYTLLYNELKNIYPDSQDC